MITSPGRALLCLATALAFSAGTIVATPILAAHVSVSTGPTLWTYTVFNDQSPGDPDYVSSFTLEVSAPVFAITSPDGWIFSTDDVSYVQWFNTDPALPYPHDIAPGTSLSGFSLSSAATFSAMLSYGLSGWDHALDQPGPTSAGTVLAPSVSAPVSTPEPASMTLLGSGLLLFICRRWFLAVAHR